MSRRCITARDIDECLAAGVDVLELADDVIVTDLARERAAERGVRLARTDAALERAGSEVRQQVRAAVIARLGQAPEGLDAIIDRVLARR